MDQMLQTMLLNDDVQENISLVTYIATSTENLILSNRLETVSKIVFVAFKHLNSNCWENLVKLLQENDEKHFINIDNYKISVSNKWLFQVILLNSVKTADNALINKMDVKLLNKIIGYIMQYLLVTEKNSLYLLRSLQFILLKRGDVLTPSISMQLLKCMNVIALSPITGFRAYVQGISKICLRYLTVEDQLHLCNINNLPIRNIETYDLMMLFSQKYIRINLVKVVNKIIKSFHTNIENKDGGIFYNRLLSFYSFEEWATCIWPLLVKHVTTSSHEGEFFQSLIKYWIPHNVSVYKNRFYLFLRDKPIDPAIKAYALLETRKKAFTTDVDLNHDIQTIFCHPETVNIALQIISTYYKKTICPGQFELKLVLEFLYTNTNMFLDEEQIKSLKLFFSQLFLYAHNNLKKSELNFEFYQKFVTNIYSFCITTLKVEFFEVGAQILEIILNISKGSYKNLTLLYKLEKKDFYDATENNLFTKLKYKSLWKFEDSVFLTTLKHCFIKNGSSKILTNLIVKYYTSYEFVGIEDMRFVLENCSLITLKNVEKLANISIVFFKHMSGKEDEFNQKINSRLLNNLSIDSCTEEKNIFNNTLYLEFLSISVEKCSKFFDLNLLLNKCLSYIDSILNVDLSNTGSYQYKKVLETFINTVLNCIMKNLSTIILQMDKHYTMKVLIKIIEISNMKKSVTLSAETLKQIASNMHEDNDMNLKIKLLNETLETMRDAPVRSNLKIRRNPESRLVIYALCSSDKNADKVQTW